MARNFKLNSSKKLLKNPGNDVVDLEPIIVEIIQNNPPAGDGNGVYSGSGTMPPETTISLGGDCAMVGDGTTFYFETGLQLDGTVHANQPFTFNNSIDITGSSYFTYAAQGPVTFYNYTYESPVLALSDSQTYIGHPLVGSFNFQAEDGFVTFTDDTASRKGIQYADNNVSTIVANERSIPDVGAVKTLIQTYPAVRVVPTNLSGGVTSDVDGILYYSTFDNHLYIVISNAFVLIA